MRLIAAILKTMPRSVKDESNISIICLTEIRNPGLMQYIAFVNILCCGKENFVTCTKIIWSGSFSEMAQQISELSET